MIFCNLKLSNTKKSFLKLQLSYGTQTINLFKNGFTDRKRMKK